MIDYFFSLNDFLIYLYSFPIFLLIIFFFFLFNKKNISNKTSGFYGVFMGLSNKNILSISLLLLYYFLIIVSIVNNKFTLLTLIILIVPIVIFNIINFYIFKFFIDIVNTILLFVLLYSKSIFYNYMIDVNSYWYVIVLYCFLCLFIFFYITFVSIRRFKSIISSNKYIENNIKSK